VLIAAAAAEVEAAAPAPAPAASAPAAPVSAAAPAAPPPRPRGLRAEITVTAATAATIQLDSPAIQTGLDAHQLTELPRASRDFQDFIYLDPNGMGHPDSGLQALGGRDYGFSYLQDGQPSNGALFGSLTTAAPGLEAIDEVKVFSNAYAAEYGGLGAVVVTSRRGTNRVAGSAFYDGNADELNALTYPEKQAGLERGYPGSNTSAHRFGAALSGPIRRDRTFFFLSYEGEKSRQVGAGRVAVVPTAAMRTGDFSGADFTLRDPLTGQPFPGNVIPGNRLSPEGVKILDFFYPEPNLGLQSSGLGLRQDFVNMQGQRHRADLRLDHEISKNDSAFVRLSWQYRDPGTTFEEPRFPLLGVLDRQVEDRTLASTWVHVFSAGALNEFRAGYNSERVNRRSNYIADQVAGTLGLSLPVGTEGRRGYPAFSFSGANSISSVPDDWIRANRNLVQSAFAVSDTFTWLRGRHSLKVGGQYSRDRVEDGFANSVASVIGTYFFDGSATGNSLADLLLGLPVSAESGMTSRGSQALDVTSQTLAAFVQDDWRVSDHFTAFLGLRYSVVTPFVERNDLLANFDPKTGAAIIPTQATADALRLDPALYATELASELGLGRALVRTDYSNVSPRAGFAWRLDRSSRTVLRGGVGLFYPTAAAQGIRDQLSRNAFRQNVLYYQPSLANAFSGPGLAALATDTTAVDTDLESPRTLQYNLTLERELPGALGLRLSFLGTARWNLVVNRYLNSVKASPQAFDPSVPEDLARLPYPRLGPGLIGVASDGHGHSHALQVELMRQFRNSLGLNAAYTWFSSRTTAPNYGNSSLGPSQYDPYDASKSEGPDPYLPAHRFVMNAVWNVPVGRGRRMLSDLPVWADLLIGGWTLSGIVQARTGYHLNAFYTGIDDAGRNPANTGVPLLNGIDFAESWRPDLTGDPRGQRARDNFFNVAALAMAAPGTTGNAPQGFITGPGTWVVNLGLYKDLVRSRRFTLQFRAVLDNAFNHPQFYVIDGSDFLDVTDYVVNGLSPGQSNGTTNVLNEVGSDEGFAPGRQIRLGIRLQF
jgi:hypothetical protein